MNVLCKRLSGSSIIERIDLIGEKVKGYAYTYFETIKKSINLALYAKIIMKHIMVKFA